jgi:lysyl-tRNA synthetase, class II
MGREGQIIQEKLRKLKEMKKLGIDAYPAKFDKKHTVSFCLKSKLNSKVKTAGRIMIKRKIGKIIFSEILDGTGKMQIVLQDTITPKKSIDLFKKYLDAGDFIGIEGKIIKTKTGQLSILANKIELLTKSLLPLPDKWHGLKDEEEKFRKRYLDIIMNPEIRELFSKKEKFWNSIREFLKKKDFMEVETPILENSAGGASATPFKTHHYALDIDVFLRISMGELWQKKLIVAGYEKTFEIGRQFRNEGMDMEHLQDYSQMEFYWAYANYEMGMKLTEEMYKKVTKDVLGTFKFKTRGYNVDLGKKWQTYDFEKTIKKHTGIDIYKADKKQIKSKLEKLKVEHNPYGDKWRLVDALWKYCRKKLTGPGFLVGQPVEVSPLAKRDVKNKNKVQQFQIIIAGSEMGNGYSELNDPLDQEERFEEQAKLKKAGDEEAQDHDKEFVEALKYGMPPTCGFGVSERFFSYLVDRPMRECQIFPLMKPLEEKKKEAKKKK